MPNRPPADRDGVRRPYTTRDPAVDASIAELTDRIPDALDRQLVTELMTTAYRLGAANTTTGDLKLLNSALKELQYAFKVFRPYRHIRKVATFGSARLPRRHPAYGMAKTFGAEMARAGWMVITGAASGIMKAGHEGAGRAASVGLNIRLPFEQEANPVIARDEKLINCKYFFTRKLLFIKESHATALFPGGFGTLDEGFESLTLVQTGKSDPRPIVLVEAPRGTYWKPMLRFFDRQLIAGKMISPEDRSIYQVARSGEEAAQLVLSFYRMYHSMRYVGHRLVIRLQQALPPGAADRLGKEFKDLVAGGGFVESGPLPGEADEPELAARPRLAFAFTRQSYGRLTQMIHRLNDLAPRD